jgi:hypothetical protein
VRIVKQDDKHLFAVVELYTHEDAAFVLERAGQDRLRVNGRELQLSYLRSSDEAVIHNNVISLALGN